MVDAIIAEGLSKTFNGTVKAVEGVSFAVREGEAFGFLGPNGAGKTTTVSMLTAGLAPTAGRASVGGIDVLRRPDLIKKSIGIVFQESTADGELTGRENLEIGAALFGVPRPEVRARVADLLERMHLADAADRLVKTYSGGMRRRLELAVGIVHEPRTLFLDEPTLGLDPQSRAGFWEYVKGLQREHGMTLFITTHYLDEADNYCDRLAIIDHGKIAATGTPSELKDRLGGDVITIRPSTAGPDLTALLRAVAGVTSVHAQDSGYRVKCPNGEGTLPALVQACFAAGVVLAGVSLKRPSLDEVFLEFTGREFREDEGPSATDMAVRIQHVRSARGR
ncbi:MAG: ATP-binding cassette domain-containing protein [Thermoplasmata archaeon]